MEKIIILFFVLYIPVCNAAFCDNSGTIMDQNQMDIAETILSQNQGRVVLFYWEKTLEIARLIDFKKDTKSNKYKAFIEMLYIPVGPYQDKNKLINESAEYTRILERNIEQNNSNIYLEGYIQFEMLYIQDKENHFINAAKIVTPRKSNKYKNKEISFNDDFYKLFNEVRTERSCSRYRCEHIPYLFNGYGVLISKVIGENENIKLQYPVKESGPSFSCSKAKTRVEGKICNHSALSDLDLEMANLYSARVNLEVGIIEDYSSMKDYTPWILDEIVSSQKSWIKRRNQLCEISETIEECLLNMYINRISTLNDKGFKWDETFGRN